MATTRALSHGNLRAVIVLPLLFMLVYGHMAVGLSFLVSARRPSDSLADTAWHFPIYKIGGVERRFLKRGYGGFGALGHYVYHRELLPRKVNGPWEGKISHIATSGAHTAAITDSGELYTWGCDEGDGRLGLGSGGGPGEAGSLSVPSKVNALPVQVAAVACGGFFTMALTPDGQLWSWGVSSVLQAKLTVGATGGAGAVVILLRPDRSPRYRLPPRPSREVSPPSQTEQGHRRSSCCFRRIHPDCKSRPPWGLENGGAFIIHYTYGCDYDMKGKLIYGKVGECRFDKRSYDSKPPRNLPLPQNGIPQSVNHPKICEAGQCMHRGTNYGRLGLLSFQEYTLMNMAF
uniref:Hydroxyproline O-arabinosyltransferase-like domain-containing protein n=1 Tax=Oryza glumipatula TaxID=40148 RepID=A0A0E0BHD7_9ORYZ